MADCTRRRRVSAPLEDILWNRDQDQQSSYIAAQELAEADRAAAHDTLIARIAADYDFTVSATETFFSALGEPLQLGMDVTSKADPRDRCTVVFTPADGSYAVYLPVPVSLPAQAFVAAVQARVQANRRQRLQADRGAACAA